MTAIASERPVKTTGRQFQTSKFLWGGLGGLAPVLASLVVVDAEMIANWADQNNIYSTIGYAVRVAGLFAIGGIWAYLHKSEKEPLKLFQLGVVAPAMISGMISASNVHDQRTGELTAFGGFSLAVISQASADEHEPPKPEPPEPTPTDEFIDGLLGR